MKNKTIKQIGSLLLALLLLFALTACGADGKAEPTAPSAGAQGALIDREGNAFVVPEKMDRIVSMAPAITETLVHLGLGNRLVGVDQYSVGIEDVPVGLPTFDIMTPDAERLSTLKPDIIFTTGMTRVREDDPFAPLRELGFTVSYLPSSDSLAAIREDIRFLAAVTKTEEKGETIIAEMDAKIADITAKIGEQAKKQTVFFEIAAAPQLYSFGHGVFLNELIELLGAKNILAEEESWVTVSEESVLGKNPEVIFTNVDYVNDPIAEILGRSAWQGVSAVKEKRVFEIDKNASARPNEYVTVALLEMAKALYPEKFQ